MGLTSAAEGAGGRGDDVACDVEGLQVASAAVAEDAGFDDSESVVVNVEVVVVVEVGVATGDCTQLFSLAEFEFVELVATAFVAAAASL